MRARQMATLGATRVCKKCGYPTPVVEFFSVEERKREPLGCRVFAERRSLTCDGCVQEQKDARKRADRILAKARKISERHLERHNAWAKKNGAAQVSKSDWTSRFGWEPAVVAKSLRKALTEGGLCPDCEHPFLPMSLEELDAHPEFYALLDNVSLDVANPSIKPPVFADGSTRWVCKTCNAKKGSRDLHQWRVIVNEFKLRAEYLKTRVVWTQGDLFA